MNAVYHNREVVSKGLLDRAQRWTMMDTGEARRTVGGYACASPPELIERSWEGSPRTRPRCTPNESDGQGSGLDRKEA